MVTQLVMPAVQKDHLVTVHAVLVTAMLVAIAQIATVAVAIVQAVIVHQQRLTVALVTA
jgi:uncharacterized membrane protein